ncbi:hypothetical protein NPIL_537461, partial [Nephila pilipes]
MIHNRPRILPETSPLGTLEMEVGHFFILLCSLPVAICGHHGGRTPCYPKRLHSSIAFFG